MNYRQLIYRMEVFNLNIRKRVIIWDFYQNKSLVSYLKKYKKATIFDQNGLLSELTYLYDMLIRLFKFLSLDCRVGRSRYTKKSNRNFWFSV
jgi:hypothetical protein